MPRYLQIFSNVDSSDTAFFSKWCDTLRDEGWHVAIISSLSMIEYRQARSAWPRFVVRWKMYPGFIREVLRACRSQPDATRIVTTNPFFAPWLAALAGGRRGRTIMLLYDLFPDALEAGTSGKHSGIAHRIMAGITRRAIQRCDAVVYLGDRLQRHVEERYGKARHSAVIPVGADASMFNHPPTTDVKPKEVIKVLYCGQLGRMHDLETLRDLFTRHPARPGFQFCFHASGSAYQQFRQDDRLQSSPWNIDWQDALPLASWKDTMELADIGLITLRPGAEKVAMPSKTYSAMAAGQAILAIAPADSDLAVLIHQHDCGWVVPPGNVDALDHILAWIRDHQEELQKKQHHARTAARQYYDMPVIQTTWNKLLNHE